MAGEQKKMVARNIWEEREFAAYQLILNHMSGICDHMQCMLSVIIARDEQDKKERLEAAERLQELVKKHSKRPRGRVITKTAREKKRQNREIEQRIKKKTAKGI